MIPTPHRGRPVVAVLYREALPPRLTGVEKLADLRLRWVHVSAAGVSELFFDELIASDVVYTNSRGVLSRAIAEFARGLVSATVLAAMKSSARLINAARGEMSIPVL
jgi:phosphoglycerate dehydrogenase-like enzyme